MPRRNRNAGAIRPDLDQLAAELAQLAAELCPDTRAKSMRGRRKVTRDDTEPVRLVVIDEYAYYSAAIGKKADWEDFAALARNLIARGRTAGLAAESR